ncbi:hypothetical protein FRC10_004839, partial [Ceratobasidium sp. 414]
TNPYKLEKQIQQLQSEWQSLEKQLKKKTKRGIEAENCAQFKDKKAQHTVKARDEQQTKLNQPIAVWEAQLKLPESLPEAYKTNFFSVTFNKKMLENPDLFEFLKEHNQMPPSPNVQDQEEE